MRLQQKFAVLWLCALGLGAPSARADSANASECSGEGSACTVPGTTTPGKCGTGACWTCSEDKAASYPCPRCLTAEQLANAGQASTPRETPPSCSSGGCSVGQLGAERGAATLLLLLGLGALGVARRRD
jgi:hypothetical protein